MTISSEGNKCTSLIKFDNSGHAVTLLPALAKPRATPDKLSAPEALLVPQDDH